MITCPECGQQANDDAKFCDRCGQGLSAGAAHASVVAIAPLEPGAELTGGFKIIALLSQASNENRYRAERVRAGRVERFQLREQLGPRPQAFDSAAEGAAEIQSGNSAPSENPNGPNAKTAELKPHNAPPTPPETAPASANGPPAKNGTAGDESIAATAAAQTPESTAGGGLIADESAQPQASAAAEGVALNTGDACGAAVSSEPVVESGRVSDSSIPAASVDAAATGG